MGTRENKNVKIAILRHPRKFKPTKIRMRTVWGGGGRHHYSISWVITCNCKMNYSDTYVQKSYLRRCNMCKCEV